MSLKAFHVLFITISVLLCFGFGVWCFGSDFARGKTLYAAVGIASFVLGVSLVVYEIFFLRKLKGQR